MSTPPSRPMRLVFSAQQIRDLAGLTPAAIGWIPKLVPRHARAAMKWRTCLNLSR
jgi:hypothetical protein